MYIGTYQAGAAKTENGGKAGAAYVTRTRDPIITNNRPLRQTAVFSPNCALISPICAVFVSSLIRHDVHRYIAGRCGIAVLAPALTTTIGKDRNG